MSQTFSQGVGAKLKIDQNAFSKYVLDLLVEQFAPYCEARFSFFKITTPPSKYSDNEKSINMCLRHILKDGMWQGITTIHVEGQLMNNRNIDKLLSMLIGKCMHYMTNGKIIRTTM